MLDGMKSRWASSIALALLTAYVSCLECNVAAFEAALETLELEGFSSSSVVYASTIPPGGSSFDPSPEYPINATYLPELCAVKFNVKSSETTSYNLAILLPGRERWNGRLMTTGNGGFGGGINYPDMGEYTHYGFVSVSTDTGHLSDIGDSSWALNNPESIVDWSYRALHGSVALAKQIVPAYYSNNKTAASLVKFSYYTGCATGGRQGLRSLQLYPNDFDGVLVGDAAWQTTNLQSWSTWMPLQNYPPNASYHIPESLFNSVTARITSLCDSQDGIIDSIIQDSAGCSIDYAFLLCSCPTRKQTACLTKPQLATLRKMLSPYTINDEIVFPGLPLGSDPSLLASESNPIGYGYFQNFLYNDTSYNFTLYTDDDYIAAAAGDPGHATAKDFDITSFKESGGKILMYHGYADPLIPAGSSIQYVTSTLSTMGIDESQLSSFLRLFLIPGMGHCVSNAPTQPGAPWYIAAASQIAGIAGRLTGVNNITHSVPGYMDARHDSVMALVKWVEEGVPPDELVATKFVNDTAPVVESQRTVCPWPKVARYTGGGLEAAHNWVCD
ncbi:feruloyl esterase B precursor [Xylaria bambusicola]|uniref:feruloyl esterase B precursor n=1 Tax=Xylaria bambusicola TaxID=326684 RepID=UPI0020077389|nr:feruloyl esterase B precursor [Xylaria bambusicola]KAI0517986.1 feruloyl esterase B precursor [Xylaria bambusicola]